MTPIGGWTTETPSTPGYYFWRSHKKMRGEIRWVAKMDGMLIVLHNANVWPLKEYSGHWWPKRIKYPDEDIQK